MESKTPLLIGKYPQLHRNTEAKHYTNHVALNNLSGMVVVALVYITMDLKSNKHRPCTRLKSNTACQWVARY